MGLSDQDLLGVDGGTGVVCVTVFVTIASVIYSAYSGCLKSA